MKALLFHSLRDMRLEEIPDPVVQPGWVITKVKVVQPSVTEAIRARGGASFGTDLVKKMLEERVPLQLYGHEFSGEVVQIGEGVESCKVGDHVAGKALISCHNCTLCRSGYHHRCKNGPTIGREFQGAFAEFIALPSEALIKLPDGMPYSDGACLQPLSSCIPTVADAGIEPGDVYVSWGRV